MVLFMLGVMTTEVGDHLGDPHPELTVEPCHILKILLASQWLLRSGRRGGEGWNFKEAFGGFPGGSESKESACN